MTSLEPLITAPLSSSDGTGLILAGSENGETPKNTIHHETWESSASLPLLGEEQGSTFQSSPTPNNRAPSLNPNRIPILLGFPERFKRGTDNKLLSFSLVLLAHYTHPGQAPNPFTLGVEDRIWGFFSPFSPLQKHLIQNCPFYLWISLYRSLLKMRVTWTKRQSSDTTQAFYNFKILGLQSLIMFWSEMVPWVRKTFHRPWRLEFHSCLVFFPPSLLVIRI